MKKLFAGSEKIKLILYKRDKVKQMFAEKSGKILKNIFAKTEIKNKETNWSIIIKINKIWALKKWSLYYANNKSESS